MTQIVKSVLEIREPEEKRSRGTIHTVVCTQIENQILWQCISARGIMGNHDAPEAAKYNNIFLVIFSVVLVLIYICFRSCQFLTARTRQQHQGENSQEMLCKTLHVVPRSVSAGWAHWGLIKGDLVWLIFVCSDNSICAHRTLTALLLRSSYLIKLAHWFSALSECDHLTFLGISWFHCSVLLPFFSPKLIRRWCHILWMQLYNTL